MIEIKVPVVGESIQEVTLLRWNKKDGDFVEMDDVIAELESEKATFEVNAEKSGLIKIQNIREGDTLRVGDLLATIDETAPKPAAEDIKSAVPDPVISPEKKKDAASEMKSAQVAATHPPDPGIKASPLASAMIADTGVDLENLKATGLHGKILKEDVVNALTKPGRKAFEGAELFSRKVRKEKMSNLRKTISRRLVEAKNSTAMLTTFNEADMGPVMKIRSGYKDQFKEVHGVGLGFMSFFARACSLALAEWPSVNAHIDGDELVYHEYADISIAVSTPRGLTVPVIRNVESLGMAEIEKKVLELAAKAKDSKLTTEDLAGGTFTITNGGVFGSLMSTPIINIPQSAILGMHKIEERPVAANGQVVIRPMMYLALSYDHRVIDGRESVGFLVRVKELIENPEQMLMGKDPVKILLGL